MNISPISNKENCSFKAYKITPKGLDALYNLTNVEEKRAIIDCCKYFKGYKYAHVKVDTSSSGNLDINLSIPDYHSWIIDFQRPYHEKDFNSKGIYISADTAPYTPAKLIFVNLNGKQGDEMGINGMSKMNELLCKFDHINYTIFQKIEAFKTLGAKVEEARISMEKSKQMNSEVDDLAANQNL